MGDTLILKTTAVRKQIKAIIPTFVLEIVSISDTSQQESGYACSSEEARPWKVKKEVNT